MASSFLKKQAEKQAKGIRNTFGEGVYGSTPYIDRVTEYEQSRRDAEEEWRKRQNAQFQAERNAEIADWIKGTSPLELEDERQQQRIDYRPQYEAEQNRNIAEYIKSLSPLEMEKEEQQRRLEEQQKKAQRPGPYTLTPEMEARYQYENGVRPQEEGPYKLTPQAEFMYQYVSGRREPEKEEFKPVPPTQRLTPDVEAEYVRRASGQAPSSALTPYQQYMATYNAQRENEARRAAQNAESAWPGVGRTAGGMAANFISGVGQPIVNLARGIEGIDDMLYRVTGNERFNLDRAPGLRTSEALKESDEFAATARELREKVGPLGQQLIDAAGAAGNMLSSFAFFGMGANAAGNPVNATARLANMGGGKIGSALGRLGARAGIEILSNPGNFGISLGSAIGSYSEAYAKGAGFGQAMTNGLLKGMTEYYSNKLFSGTPFEDSADKGYVTKLIERAASDLGGSDILKFLNDTTGGKVINWAFDKAGEGLEEVVTGVLDPMIDRITYDRTKDLATVDELTEEFIGGVLLSFLMEGGEAVISGLQSEVKMTEREAETRLVKRGVDPKTAKKYAKDIAETVTSMLEDRQIRSTEYEKKSIGDPEVAAKGASSESKTMQRYAAVYNREDSARDLRRGANPTEVEQAAFLTENEAKNYFYIWNNQGAQAADVFYEEYLTPALEQRRNAAMQQYIQQAVREWQAEDALMRAEARQREEEAQRRQAQAEETLAAQEAPTRPPVPQNRAVNAELQQETEQNSQLPVQNQQETAQERTAPPLPQREQRQEVPTPPVPQNVQTAQDQSGRLIVGTAQSGKDNTRLLWTAPKDNGGWKRQFNGNTPMLDALKATNEELLAAYMAEGTEGNTDTPVIDAVIAVWEDVRQGTISPMAGAELVNRMWQAGKDDASRRAYLRSIYNPGTGNLTQQALKAARNIDIKHRGGLTVGQADNSAAAVGQQANAGQNENAYAAEAAEAGNDLADGGRGRIPGQRAGEQDGRLAEAKRAVSQYNKASGRRADAKNLRAEEVDARDHIAEAAKGSKITIVPEQMVQQDKELRAVAQRLEEITGIKVYFIIGNIKRQGADGSISQARGAITADGIYLRCDHNDLSVTQLGAHELYHYYEDLYPGLSTRMKEKIIQTYSEEEFNKVAQVYVKKLGGVCGLSDNQDALAREEALASIEREIFADAFGSINFGGAKADKFNALVRQTVSETAGAETAAATARRTGPPSQFSTQEESLQVRIDRANEMLDNNKTTREVFQETGIVATGTGELYDGIEGELVGRYRRGRETEGRNVQGRMDGDSQNIRAGRGTPGERMGAGSGLQEKRDQEKNRVKDLPIKRRKLVTGGLNKLIADAPYEGKAVADDFDSIDEFAEEVYYRARNNQDVLDKWDKVIPGLKELLRKVTADESIENRSEQVDSIGNDLSENQQKYFKNSVIRDADGCLYVLYHGTARQFEEFDPERSGENYQGWSEFGSGIYLTGNKEVARYFAEKAAKGAPIVMMELYANITNPLLGSEPVPFSVKDYVGQFGLDDKKVAELQNSGEKFLRFLVKHGIDPRPILIEKKYDGVLIYQDWDEPAQVIAYYKNQVKRTDNKNPTADNRTSFSMDEETDAEYMAAAEAGEEQKAERYVKQAAKSWGAATDSEGKIVDLYHGTPRFGFTIFDNSGRQTATTGLIYTTTKREVSANYAGRENYAGVRQIGRQFIDGATRIQDIIQNAKSVTGFDYTELTDSKREELKKKPERISDELADRIDGLYNHSFDPGKWDDEDYTFANALSMVYDPFFIVRGRDTEGYTKEEMVEYLKPELESFEKNLETVRNYVSEHRDEFKAGNKALYDLLTGYDLFDAYVDLKYNYIPLLEEKYLLVNKRYDTDIAIPAKLQDTLEQRKDIGSYHLYGNLGNKPLTIDAKGGDWLGIRAPEFTGEDKVHSTDWLAQEAKKQGYTAIIIQNVYDGGMKADDYIFFDPSQVKSADPVTYDDDGNIIPLSERFNPQKQDIRWSADEEEIPQSATEYARMKERDREREAELRRLEKSGKATEEQKKEAAELRKKNKGPKAAERKQQATIAKKDLRNTIISQFGIPNGRKAEIGSLIDAYADRIIRDRRLTYDDQRELFDKLYKEGVMTVAADDAFKAAREIVRGGKVFVSEKVKHDFGEDWNDFRKQAFAEGIYLTNNPEDRGADSWNAELATELPGMFPEDNYDQKDILERIVSAAQAGRDEQMSLAEYAAKVVGQDYVSEDDMMDNMERQLDWALRTFADKAGLEIYLRGRTEKTIAEERERFGQRLDAARAQEIARQAKEREKRKEAARKQTLNRELREMQDRTLKQLQWLSRNRQKFSGNMQDRLNEILSDIDVYAISAADEAHLDKASNKTWRELADIYKDARENDPNFLPSKDLERIVARLDNRKIGDMDIDAVTDLYKAAVGLRTELYNRNNVIGSELHETFQEVYDQVKGEMQKAKGGYQTGAKGVAQKFFSDLQLTPMNMLERMAGWNKDSAWYKMAKQLEQGERAQRKFKTDSARMLAPFLEKHKEWVKKADGQGKDAIWYEIEVPELLELGMGDKPIFGNTVKVYMTPAQKVHMYLESQNYDNLRHMTGGRTFADRELYSKGKRAEAFAQGKTIRLAPETVKNLVKDLTPEEKALADALRPFYNEFSKKEINRVSNLLLGYNKAMEGDYAPIYTNQNYTKSEPGIFDTTAEGVGNLKSRVVSANPSLNISALDAFEKSVDRTSRYVGLAIPVRNMNTLMNWREKGNSMADVLTHKWGEDGKRFVNDLLTELQSGRETEQSSIEKLTNAALSRYISAVFGANPSIVTKQFASYPLAAAYLGGDNMPLNIPRAAKVDTDLIAKYTGEYDYRQLGYAMPETATLKDNPGKLQERGPLNFVIGGGAITWMDGFTVRTLWTWAENKVNKEQPGLEKGSQADIDAGNSEYYKAVAAEFEEALSRSQPMYDTMHRANIMRESNPITRAFTLFKTVPMQEYNMLRQAIGEAQYAKEAKLDKETQAAARQKAGRAFAGILAGNLMIGAITILNALWKNRGKKYRDEDGEISAEKLIAEAGKQYFKDAAGLVIGGGEAADILSSILFGDKWYGLETPGMEQTVKAGQTVQGLVKDSIEVLANGGNWAQYMADHSDKYISAVDSVARTLGTYATGLPIDNVKAYLLGAVQWLSPEVKTAYEDIMDKADRSGLKGLSGASLEIRTKHILQERAGSADEETAETLAGLYEAGYKDAIPAAHQTKVSIDGEERQMNLAQQQTYKRAWQETVGGSIDELVSSDEFREADEATQAKMLKKLYDLASDRAKRTLFDDAEENTWEKAEGMLDAGISLADYVSAYARFNAIKNTENLSSYDKGKRQRELINGMDYGDDAKLALYQSLNPTATSRIEKFKEIMGAGISFDKLMEVFDKYSAIDEKGDLTAAGKSKEFALWVDNQKYSEKQKQTIKDQLLYWQQMSAQTERYDKIKAQGFDPNTAAAIDKALSDLTPLPGKDGVSNAQKWNAALDVLGPKASKEEKLSAVSMFFDTEMTTESGKPSQWAKINRVVDSGKSVEDTMKMVEDEKLDVYVKWMDSDAKAAGIKSDTYISFREKYNNTKSVKDENGKDVKGQTKKDQMMAYINGLNLTADQKDKLFLEEYAESGLKDTPWHKGGGKGSGSYAPARLVTRKTPEAPRAAKPRSGLVAMGQTKAAARPRGGLVATGRPYSAGTGGLVLKKK